MRIKSIFGFCSCKGCKERYQFNVEIKSGNFKKNVRLCGMHATQLCKNGTLKSVMYNERANT